MTNAVTSLSGTVPHTSAKRPMQLALYAELAIGNITRRVLHMIREESEQVTSVRL